MDIAASWDIQQQHIAACICLHMLASIVGTNDSDTQHIGPLHDNIFKKTTKSDLYLCHHEFGCPSVEITFDNTNANGQNCTRFEEGKYHIIQHYINSYYVIIQALSA